MKEDLVARALESVSSRVLYVYADETGNDQFDAEGSKFFAIAAYMTPFPLHSAIPVKALVYSLQASGQERRRNGGEPYATLHATYDHPAVRAQALAVIESLADISAVYIAYLEKRKMNPSIRGKTKLYEITAKAVAKFVAKKAREMGFERVVFAFDQALNGKSLRAFKSVVKPELKAIGVPYTLMFHKLGDEPNGQVSDYIAWAFSRKMERGESEYLDLIPRVAKSMAVFDLYRNGDTYYY